LAPFPAYTPPATPGPLSLNAEPGAEAACPGSNAVESLLRQVCEGCPVVPGLPARLDATGIAKRARAAAIPTSNRLRVAMRGWVKWARIGGSSVDAVRLWCLRARY